MDSDSTASTCKRRLIVWVGEMLASVMRKGIAKPEPVGVSEVALWPEVTGKRRYLDGLNVDYRSGETL